MAFINILIVYTTTTTTMDSTYIMYLENADISLKCISFFPNHCTAPLIPLLKCYSEAHHGCYVLFLCEIDS